MINRIFHQSIIWVDYYGNSDYYDNGRYEDDNNAYSDYLEYSSDYNLQGFMVENP